MEPARDSVWRRAGRFLAGAFVAIAILSCGSSTDVPATIPGIHKILILGNSITLHGPSPEIGWTGDWGMAATSAARDYAHVVAAHVPGAALEIHNISTLETNPELFALHSLDSSLAQAPDLVIVELGDNARDASTFRTAYQALMSRIVAAQPARILCTTTWWGGGTIDAVIRSACTGPTARVVEIGDLYANPLNRAASERSSLDSGVAIHPGDRGMTELANAILRSLAQ
jgi:hypothetical protein